MPSDFIDFIFFLSLLLLQRLKCFFFINSFIVTRLLFDYNWHEKKQNKKKRKTESFDSISHWCSNNNTTKKKFRIKCQLILSVHCQYKITASIKKNGRSETEGGWNRKRISKWKYKRKNRRRKHALQKKKKKCLIPTDSKRKVTGSNG